MEPRTKTITDTPLAQRIVARLRALGISARAASLAASGSDQWLRTILSGRTAMPMASRLASLADVLQCDVRWLLGEPGAPAPSESPLQTGPGKRPPAAMARGTLAIVGEAAAGRWIERDTAIDAEPWPAAADPRWPPEAQYLVRVVGRSMDQAHIPNGALVHCLDAAAIGYAGRAGDIVLAERARFGGQIRERTVKRLRAGARGGLELVGESSDPAFNAPLPLFEGVRGEDDSTVSIAALVVAVLIPLAGTGWRR